MSSWRRNHWGGFNKAKVLCLPSPLTLLSVLKYYNTFNSRASNMDLCWSSFHEEKNTAVAVSRPKQIPLQRSESKVVFHRAHMAQHMQLHRAVSSSQQGPATASRPCSVPGQKSSEHTCWPGSSTTRGFMKGRHFQRRKRLQETQVGRMELLPPVCRCCKESKELSVNLEQS